MHPSPSLGCFPQRDVNKSTLCLTSTETRRLIWDGEKGGKGYGDGEEGDYIPIATRIISTLRWAAMRAILMFHNCEGQIHKTMYTDHKF